jgi:hypothetical protein
MSFTKNRDRYGILQNSRMRIIQLVRRTANGDTQSSSRWLCCVQRVRSVNRMKSSS